MKRLIIFILIAGNLIFLRGQDSISIGFNISDLNSEWWYKNIEAIKGYAKEKRARVTVLSPFEQTEKQITQCEGLISGGIDVLIIVPAESNNLCSVVEYANKYQTKVIACERLIMGCNIDYYVSFNYEKIGEMQAQYAVDNKPKGNYVLLRGPSKDNNAVLCAKGQRNILQPYIESGNIKLVDDLMMIEWNELAAFLAVQNTILNSGVHIDAVIASDDRLANGAVVAADYQQYNNIVITGQDGSQTALKNIISGKQSMTVFKDIKKLIETSIDLAILITNGEKPTNINKYIYNDYNEIPSIIIDPVLVDKNNVNKFWVVSQ